MSFLQGLHGTIALLLLSSLLFAEEAGVPLPFAPGELVLVAAGLLIASGGLDLWIFLPLAMAACLLGAFAGYSWARLVGEQGLRLLASRFRQDKRLARVTDRLRAAGVKEIAFFRLIPGFRIYTTLAAGAAAVPRRRFVAATLPTTVGWVLVFTLLGMLVGLPAERFLGQVEKFAVQGALLVAIGLGAYVTIRRVPATDRAVLFRVPNQLRMAIAAIIDLAIIASIVTGFLAVIRALIGAEAVAGWLDTVILFAVIVGLYFFLSRRGLGATAGEALLGTTYLTRRRAGVPHLFRLRNAGGDAAALARTSAARAFRRLGNPRRLQALIALLEKEHSATELAEALHLSQLEALCVLAELRGADLVATKVIDGTVTYNVPAGLSESLLTIIAHIAGSNGAVTEDGGSLTSVRFADDLRTRPPS